MFDPGGQEDAFPTFAAAFATLEDEDPEDPVASRAFELGLGMLIASARPGDMDPLSSARDARVR